MRTSLLTFFARELEPYFLTSSTIDRQDGVAVDSSLSRAACGPLNELGLTNDNSVTNDENIIGKHKVEG